MQESTNFERFFAWLQRIVPLQLASETDVTTKFVIELLSYLGYPTTHYRTEYPLSVYEPNKRGRKPAIDLVYFVSGIEAEQNADTSLLMVETKKPKNKNLAKALEQIYYYAYHLNTPLLLVTNQHRIILFKIAGNRREEIFNITLQTLQTREVASSLYRQLQYSTVKRLKEIQADGLTHSLYVDIMYMLHRSPDLHAQLAKGDFARRRSREGQRLTVVEPKVAMTCDLPLGLGNGACQIEFSNPLLRGLTCHLSHQQILTTFMIGLGTPPSWRTRPFLRQRDNKIYEAHLGYTTVFLSELEAQELCLCIDEACTEYKSIIANAEDTLETWNYMPMQLREMGIEGFRIVSIRHELWTLMRRFAREFDAHSGDTNWHIFDTRHTHLRVIQTYPKVNVEIYPSYNLRTEMIELVYRADPSLLSLIASTTNGWQQAIGPKGYWTALYTEAWLEGFIDHIAEYYGNKQSALPTMTFLKEETNNADILIPSTLVNQPREFANYVNRVQHWLHEYRGVYVAAKQLKNYYRTLNNLVHTVEPESLKSGDIGYCWKHLQAAQHRLEKAQLQKGAKNKVLLGEIPLLRDNSKKAQAYSVKQILQVLDWHVERIHSISHEDPHIADDISSVIYVLLSEGDLYYSQEHFNAAKDSLDPLLRGARFEECYALNAYI